MSTSPRRRLVSCSMYSSSRICRWTSRNSRLNVRSVSGISSSTAIGTAPMRSSPTMCPPSCAISSTAPDSSRTATQARSYSTLPCVVGTTPVVERVSSVADSSRSSSRTVLVSAGCDTPTRRAAARRLPSSTAAIRACRAWSFMRADRSARSTGQGTRRVMPICYHDHGRAISTRAPSIPRVRGHRLTHIKGSSIRPRPDRRPLEQGDRHDT